MTKNILKSKLTKPLKYKEKLQFLIKDKNDSESSHNPKVVRKESYPRNQSLNLESQEIVDSLFLHVLSYIK